MALHTEAYRLVSVVTSRCVASAGLLTHVTFPSQPPQLNHSASDAFGDLITPIRLEPLVFRDLVISCLLFSDGVGEPS